MIDSRIPMMVQTPNILAAMAQETQNAANQANVMRTAELQNLYRQQGPGIMAGDPNAMNALARMDPGAAFDMTRMRREDQRADTRLGMDRERLELTRQQVFAGLQEAEDQAEAAREAAEAVRLSNDAFMAYRNGDQSRFSQITGSIGADVPFSEEGIAMLEAIASGASAFQASQGMGPSADNQTERDIALLAEIGIPRQEAIRITQLHTISRDPVTGETVVINKQTGLPVNIAPSQTGTPELPGAGAPPPAAGGVPVVPSGGVDYRGALGAEGAVTSAINGVVDFAIGQRPFQEQGRARTALSNLRTRTLTTLSTASVAGRPSNYVMEMFNQNVVQPSLLSGPEGALDTAQQTLSFLEGMIAENEAVLRSRVNPTVQSEARRNIEALKGLREDYRIVVDGLTQPTGGVTISPDVAERLKAYE